MTSREFREALARSSFGTDDVREASGQITPEIRQRILDKIAAKRHTMLPEQAQAELSSSLHTRTPEYILAVAQRALATIAAMRVEECGRVLTMEETGGAHKVKTTYRLVGEWTDRNE